MAIVQTSEHLSWRVIQFILIYYNVLDGHSYACFFSGALYHCVGE